MSIQAQVRYVKVTGLQMDPKAIYKLNTVILSSSIFTAFSQTNERALMFVQ